MLKILGISKKLSKFYFSVVGFPESYLLINNLGFSEWCLLFEISCDFQEINFFNFRNFRGYGRIRNFTTVSQITLNGCSAGSESIWWHLTMEKRLGCSLEPKCTFFKFYFYPTIWDTLEKLALFQSGSDRGNWAEFGLRFCTWNGIFFSIFFHKFFFN